MVRTLFIILLTGYAVATNSADIALPWHPFSTFGFSASADGRLTSVDAEVARTGLHVGDRLDIRRMLPAQRLYLTYFSIAPEGTVQRFPVEGAGGARFVRLVSHIRPRSLVDNVSDIIAVIALDLFLLIAAALVLMRPTPVSWAFYVFSLAFCLTGTLYAEYSGVVGAVLFTVVVNVALAASSVAFVSFALRFPDNQPSGRLRSLERTLIFAWFPAVCALLITEFLLAVNGTPVLQLFWITAVGTNVLYFAGMSILLWRYAHADTQSRNRLRWIVASFSIAFLPALAIFVVERAPFLSVLPPVWAINFAQAWELLAPIAVAYTILKHRLFDIRLVFSRALIYGITTALFVGIIALVDWAAGKWLAEWKFALVIELALALLVGISLNALHHRVEFALNGLIFRAQVKALEALRTFAHEIDLIPDPQRLLMQTFEALRARLDSEYIAIYAIDGAVYSLVRSSGSPPPMLTADDFAVLHLRRWHEAFVCEEPAHPLLGSLMLPMSARGALIGFIVCGPKADHTLYLPEETNTLATLTHRVGTAYAWLTLRPTPIQIARAVP